MSLGIEDRRRCRIGERRMTLENDRDRQQEPAVLLPRIMVTESHASTRVGGSQTQSMEGPRGSIIIGRTVETNQNLAPGDLDLETSLIGASWLASSQGPS